MHSILTSKHQPVSALEQTTPRHSDQQALRGAYQDPDSSLPGPLVVLNYA